MQDNSSLKPFLAVVALSVLSGSAAMAQVIDTFSTTLSAAYTQTTVLDNDTTRNVTFATSGGVLQATATTTAAAEQNLLLRSDFTLSIGQTLRATVPSFTGSSQDFGIAVAATATPLGVSAGATGNTRSDYIFSGFRGSQTQYVGSGFNGSTALTTVQAGSNTGGAAITLITSLFISRTSATSFSVGYDDNNGPDVIVGTYTVANSAIGNAVGFYTDMRGANTLGNLDNLSITPEPSTWAFMLGGVALLGVMQSRRRAARS